MLKKRQLMHIMHQPLSNLIFPGYRRAVLGLLLLNPDEALHGREIARRTGLPAGTLTRELRRLATAGLLKQERRGNQLLYSADRTSPVFEEIASVLRKTSGMADVLVKALAPLAAKIESAFIFGSMARGAETAGSDVDVLIVGTVDFGTVIDALHLAQRQLGREINPKVFSAAEWKAKIRAGSPFVKEILAKPKIYLIGGADESKKPGRRKS
jgi:predicted nucleotidyltransferase